MITEEEIETTSMQIILHAGNAKNKAIDAFELAKKRDFEGSKKAMEESHKEIVLAHNAQTHIIQTEASGKKVEYSALFSHAQGTLMTISTFIDNTKQEIDILKIVFEK